MSVHFTNESTMQLWCTSTSLIGEQWRGFRLHGHFGLQFDKIFASKGWCEMAEVWAAQCGICCNLVSHIFNKNFVKVTFFLKKLLKSWFDEIFFGGTKFFTFPHCVPHSVEITEIYCHFFDKNFVKVTFLLKKILKSWFDEIFYGWQ